MMDLTLECPHAKYDREMRITCRKTGELCSHQRFKPCKGWCVLTEQAGACPARKEEDHERTTVKTAKKRRNAVSNA